MAKQRSYIVDLEVARQEMRNAKTQLEYAQKKRVFRKLRNQFNVSLKKAAQK